MTAAYHALLMEASPEPLTPEHVLANYADANALGGMCCAGACYTPGPR